MSLIQVFSWMLVLLSLAGVVLNIRRRHECFYIWGVTNLCWAAIDAAAGIYSQSALQLVYFGLAAWGLWEWRARR